MPEWMASDMTLTEPIMVPTTSLMTTRVAFERMEKKAAMVLADFADFFFIR